MGTEAAIDKRAGFQFDKMREDLVDQQIRDRKLDIPKGSRFPNKVGLLQISIRNAVDPSALVECDVCNAASDIDDERCPFCGTGEDGPAPAPQALVRVDRKGLKRKPAPPPSTEVVEAPAPKAAPAELVEPSEQDLNRRVKEIAALKAGTEAAGWLLGRKIKELYDLKVWRARSSEKGGPAYRTFNQFASAELGYSGSQAYRLMDVAEQFTEEQVRRIGTTRLIPLLRLKEEDRAKLVYDIQKSNLSAQQVRRAVADKNPERRDTGRAKTPPGVPGVNARQERRFPEGSIATAFPKQSYDVQTYCKPDGWGRDKPFPPEDARRAKAMSDLPFAVIELPGDVRLQVTALEAPTGIVFKVEIQRFDPLDV